MVRRVLKILYKEIKGLHQAAYILALFAIASQMLALVRDRILAHQFGAGAELDIYYTAFRVPDLLFTLFASVLSVYVLLPFVTKSEAVKRGTGRHVLNQMMTLFLILYAAVTVVLLVFAPQILAWLFPAYDTVAQTELVLLTRILLLQPLFLGISSLAGVVTQLEHRFVIYAISPILYNIGIIIGAAFLYPVIGLSGLAFGVVLGAIGHLAVQLPLVRRSHLSFSVVSKFDWKLLRQVGIVAVPRAVTLSLNQVFLLVLIALASTMTVGSVAALQFAYNLQSVPLAIIGMSYSVAAFPTLADLLSKQKMEVFNTYLSTALRHIVFWSVPVIGLIIVLRAQIVRVLLGSGAFDWDDTRLVAAALGIFVTTLVAQAAILFLVRAFYAGGFTRLPLYIVASTTSVGAALAFYLTNWFAQNQGVSNWFFDLLRIGGVEGTEVLILPIAFSLATILQLVLLMWQLRKKFGISYQSVRKQFFESVVAAVAGALTAYITLAFVVEGVNQNTFIGIFIQGAIGGLMGVVAVILTYYYLGSSVLTEIYQSFRAKVFKTDVVAPQEEVI